MPPRIPLALGDFECILPPKLGASGGECVSPGWVPVSLGCSPLGTLARPKLNGLKGIRLKISRLGGRVS